MGESLHWKLSRRSCLVQNRNRLMAGESLHEMFFKSLVNGGETRNIVKNWWDLILSPPAFFLSLFYHNYCVHRLLSFQDISDSKIRSQGTSCTFKKESNWVSFLRIRYFKRNCNQSLIWENFSIAVTAIYVCRYNCYCLESSKLKKTPRKWLRLAIGRNCCIRKKVTICYPRNSW